MSAPLPIDFATVGAPCPSCSTPLVMPEHDAAKCRSCGALVGTPGRFVDEKRRRKPLRPAFSTGPARSCCRCHQTLQRVLVDDIAGSFCASCNLVLVARGQVSRVVVDATRLRVETEKPKQHQLSSREWLAVALALTIVGVVAAIEMGLLP